MLFFINLFGQTKISLNRLMKNKLTSQNSLEMNSEMGALYRGWGFTPTSIKNGLDWQRLWAKTCENISVQKDFLSFFFKK